MGIFGSKSDKKKISLLEQENKQNRKRIKQLENTNRASNKSKAVTPQGGCF